MLSALLNPRLPTPMFATILLACFLCGFLVLRRRRRAGEDWRATLLFAATFGGLLLTLMTEVLGAFRLLAPGPAAVMWGLVCAGLLAVLFRSPKWPGPQTTACDEASLTATELLLLTYLGVVGAFTAVLAWVAPPNTWDSQTYHMSRVVHWIQNRSVDFYPTAILRQLHSNPWAEYLILHLQLLTGTDRLANFVQWGAMIGSLAGSSAVAKELGADRRGQIIAAVACATLPMGILQSTSTQTDYVLAFWLLCVAYFSIRVVRQPDLRTALGVGGALGLAILTKGTAYVFALPFVAWLAIATLRRRERKLVVCVGIAFAVALAANAAHYARNFELYGSPLGPGAEGAGLEYSNQKFSPAVLASNLLRNAGLHLGTTEALSQVAEEVIDAIHVRLGISPNDPATTWPGTTFQVQRPSMNEDNAGNPAHWMLIGIALLIYVSNGRRKPVPTAYVAALLFGFLIFCAYLKWQPWHSRLHLPLFVLWSPFIGFALAGVSRAWVGTCAASALILTSAPTFIFSETKPTTGQSSIFAVPRNDQYFNKRPYLLPAYYESARRIKELHCTDIGLITDIEGWEYPLWILMKSGATKPIRIRHVEVGNASSRKAIAAEQFQPCSLFVFNGTQPVSIYVGGTPYVPTWSSGAIGVYAPASPQSLPAQRSQSGSGQGLR